MNRTTEHYNKMMGLFAIIPVSTLLFAVLYVITEPEALTSYRQLLDQILGDRNYITIIALLFQILTSKTAFFFVGMIAAWSGAQFLLAQYMQQLYNLSWEDVMGRPNLKDDDRPSQEIGLLNRILYGLPNRPPFVPVLGVREGRVDPDGHAVMRKVGGPGFLSVGHDTAAIIARGGTIVKVLGPGWYRLLPFERVWDVVDLRPQRRTLHVETHSRDGIPIYCDAEIVFRLDNGKEMPPEFSHLPYEWTDTAAKNALMVTTGKVVLKPGGKRRFTRWDTRMPNGILDGVIRDVVERYRLDEYLAPTENGVPLFEELETVITTQVAEKAREAGARLIQLHLGPILPARDAVSQQWIESWRSEWDRVAHELQAEAKAQGTTEIKLARVHAQAELVTTIVEAMRDIKTNDPDLESTLIFMRFLDVIRAFSEDDSIVRSTLFKEAEGLQRILKTMTEITDETFLSGITTADTPALEAPKEI